MRVAQLTIYPLSELRHGGQLRCAAIRSRYREAGIEVHGLAVMHEDAYRNERGADDIALSATWPGWNAALPRFADLQTGACLAAEPRAWSKFVAWLERVRPHVIQLEQPWLWPALRRWLANMPNGATRPRLVYSSQNIEWRLKHDEVDAALPDQAHAIAEVKALECELARAADLLVACTDADLDALREMAADHAERAMFVTAPNAIAPFRADPARIAAMRKRLGLERWPLFVGSAHPPNASGFWEMLAPSLAFLRPDEKIVVAGGVGHLLRQHKTYHAWSGINEPRLAVLGEIGREDLSALLYGAAVIVLPITTGGGSNLKTAEAIYTGKPVVATPHALRGYGDSARWPTITIAHTPDAFRRALRDLLDCPVATTTGPSEREAVTWAHTLQALAEAIGTLANGNAQRNVASFRAPTPDETRVRLGEISARIARRGGVDYEMLLERQYTRFLQPGDVVVDIGAHAGRHLARFIDCVGPHGRVVGFEPLPQMHAELRRRFASPNVELHNVALTNTSGRVEFVHAKGAPEESGLRERAYNHPDAVVPTRIEVEAQRLDRYADALDGLRFIKIDVEGAEMNVLEGATAVLDRHRPWLSVEYGRPAYGAYGHETHTLFDFAERHGYLMYDLFGHHLDRASWGVACDSIYWDYFMIPAEQREQFERRMPPLGPEAID